MLIHAAVTVQRTVGCMRREGVREVVTGKLNLVTTRKKKTGKPKLFMFI